MPDLQTILGLAGPEHFRILTKVCCYRKQDREHDGAGWLPFAFEYGRRCRIYGDDCDD